MFNSKTKTFLLLTLIFIAIMGVSAVSATDDNNFTADTTTIAEDTTTQNVDNSIYTEVSTKNTQINKKNVENVKGDGEGSFADLATDIAGSDVKLAKDYKQESEETNISITEDKTIDGAGHTITATNGTFIINSGVTLTLQNLNIVSHHGETYKTYYWDLCNNGTLNVKNVTFKYDSDNRTYGGFIATGANTNLTIEDSVFDGEHTVRSQVYADGVNAVVKIDNCKFINYNASNAAVGMEKQGNLTVTNSYFANNIETSYGGGIYVNNNNALLVVDHCTFENLTANYRGGAIYTRATLSMIQHNSFKNLSQKNPTYNAGILYLDNSGGYLYLDNNTAENIKANTADFYINNGKLYTALKVTGENVSVDQESSTTIKFDVTDDMGNTIDIIPNPFKLAINDESVTFTYGNGTITADYEASLEPGNYTIDLTCDSSISTTGVTIPETILTVNDIGLLSYADVQAKIDAAIRGTTVEIDGPVVRKADEESIVIKDIYIDFKNNTINAKNGRVFDALNTKGSPTIQNAIITKVGNSNPTLGNTEGRLLIANNSFINFENVLFENCTAPNLGSSGSGSFIIVCEKGYIGLTDCVINNCTGTFMNIIDSTVDIDNSIFENNILPTSYSNSNNALICDGGILTIKNSQFINNSANFAVIDGQSQQLPITLGSTMLMDNQELIIKNTTFINNVGSSKAGAIHTNNDTTITDCTFINNRVSGYSGYGGAIRSDDGKLDISNTVFVNNSAKYGVSWSGSISGNDGTAIANYGGDLSVKNSMILSNITAFSAIYNNAEDVTIDVDGNYWGNATPEGFYKAGYYGDEITVNNWAVLDVTVDPADNINYNDIITATATFKLTDGTSTSDLTGTLPDYESVIFSSDDGIFDTEVVELESGKASAQFTVKNSPFTITAEYPYMEATYTGEATMPEPQVYVLNDGNWTEYFNNDGTLKDSIIPNSELQFEGSFTDRDMTINVPVQITTAPTQAVLNNCTIYVTKSNVNITNIIMNANDIEDSLITIEKIHNVRVEGNNLTLTNNENMITRSVMINGGLDIVIKNNNIITAGPEEDIKYNAKGDIEILYLASIETTGQNVVIDSNIINTKKNDNNASSLGTIYGIYVHGENDANKYDNTKIINNEIITDGEVYEYGVKTHYITNLLVQNNTVTTTSNNYVSGIHIYDIEDSIVDNNIVTSKADNIVYGIVLEGAMNYSTYTVYSPKTTKVTNNVVDAEGNCVWAIETYAGNNNEINYNNITVKADQGLGIGLTDQNSIASYNNIKVTSTLDDSKVSSYDYINPYTTGIKITSNGLQSVSGNNVTFNNITVKAPENSIVGVNVTSPARTIVVTDNFLISPKGFGDDAVLNTGYSVTVKDNSPSSLITDKTYSEFFDDSCTLKQVFDGSSLKISGEFKENTVFIFDGVNVTFTNDGTAVIYDGQIMTGNNATVVFDGLVLENSFDAIVLESDNNIINNSIINVKSEDNVHVVYVTGDNNIITNTIINVTAPSADAVYGGAPNYELITPAPAAIEISSNNNLLDNITVFFDGREQLEGFSQTADGIYIVSTAETIENNTINNAKVTVTGSQYAYGVNVGNARNTIINNITIDTTSTNYADSLQLFDADTITVTGTINTKADAIGYGVYSTAMGQGYSNNINLTGLDITVEAPEATGVLLEGSQDTTIADSTYNIKGENAAAIISYVDWMGNEPNNITITGLNINIDTTGDANALYFGKANNINIDNNKIIANGGSEININATPNSSITNNYIKINDVLFGNFAVISTEKDTVIENNTPKSQKMEEMQKQLEELQKQLEELTKKENTTLTINPIEDATYNGNITITGTLTNNKGQLIANQEITLNINGKNITVKTTNGAFKYTTSIKALGEQTITAEYAGNDYYNPSNTTTTFTINKGNVIVTFDPIQDVKYGENVTITGKFTTADGKAIANSNVKIIINGKKYYAKTDKTGTFTLSAKITKTGTNNITLGYSGNTNYNSYEINTTINAEKQDVIVTYDPIQDVKKGENITITGTFKDATGKAITNSNVKIIINNKKYYAKTDSTGTYTLSVAATTVGENNITVGYSGNTNYNSYETTTKITVKT